MEAPSQISLADPGEMVIQLEYAKNVLPHVESCRGVVAWKCKAYSAMFVTNPPKLIDFRFEGIILDERQEQNRELQKMVYEAFCLIMAEAYEQYGEDERG